MSDTIEHIKNAIRYLDPEQGVLSIDKARSEMRDALNHYAIEQECRNLNKEVSIDE